MDPVRKCTGCQEEKPLTQQFWETQGAGFRGRCRACRRRADEAAKVERNRKREETGVFFCTRCKVQHPAAEAMDDRNICKKSYNSNRVTTTAEKAKVTKKEEVPGHPCTKCWKPFDPAHFRWSQTRWASECKECFNDHEYYKPGREKKRAEDLPAFLEKAAAHQKTWREANPDACKEYNEKRITDPILVIERYISKAEKMGIKFDHAEKKRLADMLKKDCHWCGLPHMEGRLNTIDRLGDDYDLETTLPSCNGCNLLRCKTSPEEMIRTMSLWHLARIERGEPVDPSLRLESKLGSRMENGQSHSAIAGRKEGRKPEIQQGVCYLCGTSGKVGIDRLDSNLNYLDDGNSQPCCSRCNYFKKDFTYAACMAHAERVYNLHGKAAGTMGIVRRETVEKSNRENDSDEGSVVGSTSVVESGTDEDSIDEVVTAKVRYQHVPRNFFFVLMKDQKVIARYISLPALAKAAGFSTATINEKFSEHGKHLEGVDDGQVVAELILGDVKLVKMRAGVWDAWKKLVLENDEDLEKAALSRLGTRSASSNRSGPYKKSRQQGTFIYVNEVSGDTPIAKYSTSKEMSRNLGISDAAISKKLKAGTTVKGRWIFRQSSKDIRVEDSKQIAFENDYNAQAQERGVGILVKDGEDLIGSYSSVSAAARALGMPTSTFRDHVDAGRSVNGYTVSKV